MSRFSRTVSSVSRLSCCGRTPSCAGRRRRSAAGSRPRTRRVPPEIGETQPIMRIVEVLPAPLGPRKPKDSPGATSKSMASTAVKSPKRLVSPRAEMSEAAEGWDTGANGTAAIPAGRPCQRRNVTCYIPVAQSSQRQEPGTMATVPESVARLLEVALVGDLTVVEATGRPLPYPLIPLWDGETVYLTSSPLFSRKLQHIKGD